MSKKDVQKIIELKSKIEDLRGEIKDKTDDLLNHCYELNEVCGRFDSFNHFSRRDYRLVEDFSRSLNDFRLPEKTERAIPDLENEIYREAREEDEIDDLLREIRRI